MKTRSLSEIKNAPIFLGVLFTISLRIAEVIVK